VSGATTRSSRSFGCFTSERLSVTASSRAAGGQTSSSPRSTSSAQDGARLVVEAVERVLGRQLDEHVLVGGQ
jgi:hypothetical protein